MIAYMTISPKYSEARIKRWAKISKEKRSEMMKKVSDSRWKGKTDSEKRNHALMMVKRREAKKTNDQRK